MDPRSLCEALSQRLPNAVIAWHTYRGDATVTIRPESLLEVAKVLKEELSFRMDFLIDITAVDYLTFGKSRVPAAFSSSGVAVSPPAQIPDEAPWSGPATRARFEAVYHFFSLPLKHRIRIKVPVEEQGMQVDSLTSLWAGADWFEREIWDMFGIRFRGHPNLKRILMYEGFGGHPLRKDYPVNKRQPLIGPVN